MIKPVQLNLTESLGEEKPYLPKGGLELQGEALINLVQGHTNKGLVQLGGAISQEACTTQRELTQ